VERGTADSIFERPQEDYTRDLIAAAFLHERARLAEAAARAAALAS
jgi:oligopeptide transport system ATP-binding protein